MPIPSSCCINILPRTKDLLLTMAVYYNLPTDISFTRCHLPRPTKTRIRGGHRVEKVYQGQIGRRTANYLLGRNIATERPIGVGEAIERTRRTRNGRASGTLWTNGSGTVEFCLRDKNIHRSLLLCCRFL